MRSWSWWGHSKKRPGVWGRSRSISWKRHLRPWKRRGSRRTAWDESSPHFPSTPLTLLATSSYSWMTAGMETRTKWEERRRRWTVGIITPKGWRETGAPHPETAMCSSDLRRLGWWLISWVSCTCQTARNSSSSCCRWGNLFTPYMLLTYFMSCSSIFISKLHYWTLSENYLSVFVFSFLTLFCIHWHTNITLQIGYPMHVFLILTIDRHNVVLQILHSATSANL